MVRKPTILEVASHGQAKDHFGGCFAWSGKGPFWKLLRMVRKTRILEVASHGQEIDHFGGCFAWLGNRPFWRLLRMVRTTTMLEVASHGQEDDHFGGCFADDDHDDYDDDDNLSRFDYFAKRYVREVKLSAPFQRPVPYYGLRVFHNLLCLLWHILSTDSLLQTCGFALYIILLCVSSSLLYLVLSGFLLCLLWFFCFFDGQRRLRAHGPASSCWVPLWGFRPPAGSSCSLCFLPLSPFRSCLLCLLLLLLLLLLLICSFFLLALFRFFPP